MNQKPLYPDKDNDTIDLLEIFALLKRKIVILILVTIFFGIAGYFINSFLMTPIYQAGAKMIVNTRQKDNANVTNDQINSAKNLVDTYSIIITSRSVLEPVIQETQLPYSYELLRSRVSVSAVNNTQVMEITVKDPNPNTAANVVSEILKFAPSVIIESVEAGSVKTIEQTYVGTKPVEPKVNRNTVVSAFLGFILSAGIVLAYHFLDNTFKSDLDLQKELAVPVLGVLPAIECCQSSGKNKSSRESLNRSVSRQDGFSAKSVAKTSSLANK